MKMRRWNWGNRTIDKTKRSWGYGRHKNWTFKKINTSKEIFLNIYNKTRDSKKKMINSNIKIKDYNMKTKDSRKL